jgi:hypothetical protein
MISTSLTTFRLLNSVPDVPRLLYFGLWFGKDRESDSNEMLSVVGLGAFARTRH